MSKARTVFTGFCILLLLAPISSSYSSTMIGSEGITENNGNVVFKQNFSNLQPGDIAFMHPDLFPDYIPTIIDHCLLFIEYNSSMDMYVFIEAGTHNSQVEYRYEPESTLRGVFFGPFAKVKHANETQKQNAIDFAKRQLGKPFQGEWINKNFNPEDTENDIFANEWYCSELIWAAYYNCNNPFPEKEPEGGYIYGDGIDLDRNGWHKNVLNFSVVAPSEIMRNRREISVFYTDSLLSYVTIVLEKIFSFVHQDSYDHLLVLDECVEDG